MKQKNKVTAKSCWMPGNSMNRTGALWLIWLFLFFNNALALDNTTPGDEFSAFCTSGYHEQKNVKIFNRLDTVPVIDTVPIPQSASALTAAVTYQATDSMVVDVNGNKIRLYGKNSTVQYAGNELNAPYIEYDQENNTLFAHLLKDSSGKVLAYPVYTQADFKSISDTIRFNMKTGRGMTKGTYTQQGELFVYGEKIKKVDTSVFYAKNGRFTTCNLDTPHFAFVSKKIKFINKKMAFTGPVHPEIEGVPLPVMLPFGIYPLSQGRHSGFMAPSFTANDQLGLALEGLGYYKILNDYWDLVLRGTIYSYGGWTFNMTPRYFKKYRYQGTFSLDMQRFKTGFKGDPDYSSSQTMRISWSHNADTKARPGVTFRANVDAGSSKFNEQVPNSPVRNFNNRMQSSISYAKVWKDKPFNLQINASHDQNTTQRLINLRFPDVAFNVNTLYPFRRKEAVGNAKWYENIGIALNTNVSGNSFFYDTLGGIGTQITDNFRWGASHRIPITLSLPSFGPFQVAPTVSYEERWYQEKFIRRWNETDLKIDTLVQRGLYTARDMSFGLGITTRLFGMFGFKPGRRVQAIRHEIRPSISISYKPNMNARSQYTTQIDQQGTLGTYNYFERSIYGAFSTTRFGGVNFGIDNVLQMKSRTRKDTAASAYRKVSLIDGLSINGSYNFLADSFALSDLVLGARSNLFDKVNITAGAVFNPYLYDDQGRRIDQLVWSKKPFSLGTLTSASIALQTSFRGGDKKKAAATPAQNQPNTDMESYQQEQDYVRNNPNEFVDFNVPWNLDLQYALRFFRAPTVGSPGAFTTTINQDLNITGSINLTPKWKIGMMGSYNLTQKQLGVLSLNLSRDLHCWQMSMAISPVGKFRFFTLNISPKSNLLRDIKVNRTRYFFDL